MCGRAHPEIIANAAGIELAMGGSMRARIAALAALATLSASTACAPRVFSDAGAIAIVGDAPPPPEPEEVAQPTQIELSEKVQFARNSARILEASFPLLDDVAQRIKDAPDIRRIRVEGHASADGNDEHNLDLSARRAAAVMDYLVEQGVAAERLTSEGFGETRPIADNDTKEGREENRRVELHIVERASDGTETAAP